MKKYIIAGVITLLIGTFFVSSYFLIRENIKDNSASVLSSILNLLGFDQPCVPQDFPAGSTVKVDNYYNTINVTIPFGRVTSMCFAPDIKTVYSNAVVTPASGEPQDFTNSVTYTVIQGKFKKTYVVTIRVEKNPYQITSWTDLKNMNNDLSKNYTLMNNLTSLDSDYVGLGDNWQPIGTDQDPFSGNFDGNGKIIADLVVNLPSTDFVGLFGSSVGNIFNVGLMNINVKGNSNVGGLIGEEHGGAVYNSYSSGVVSGYSVVGGLVGVSDGSISNSYSLVSVDGIRDVGGLVGVQGEITQSVVITNSYSTGSVNGPVRVGGLIGRLQAGTVVNSYWDMDTSGQSMSSSGEGKTTAEMKTPSTFVGWRKDVWNIVVNDYPTLKSVSKPSSHLVWSNPAPVTLCGNVLSACPEGTGSLNGEGALEYCNNLVENDNSNWKLPTIEELMSGMTNQFVTATELNNFIADVEYWSSTDAGMGYSSTGVYRFGRVGLNDVGRHNPQITRCVSKVYGDIPLTINLNVSSSTIVEGNTISLTWTPSGASSCTATGGDSSWPGNLNASYGSHTWTTGALSAGSYNYVISCTDNNDHSISTSTVVNVSSDTHSLPFKWSDDLGSMDWFSANIACDELGSTWRLPTKDELLSKYNETGATPSGWLPNNYWSSTEYDSYSVYFVNMYNGLSSYSGKQTPPLDNPYYDMYLSNLRCISSTLSTTTPPVVPLISVNVQPKVTVTLVPYTSNLMAGDKVTFIWKPSNASSCTATGGDSSWPGSLNATDGTHTWISEPLLAGNYTYNISCTGNTGIATTSAIVNVSPKITATLTSSASTINEGQTVSLTWTLSNTSSCTATGGDSSWPGNLNASYGSHTWTTGALSAGSYNYVISCTDNNDHSISTSTVVNVRVEGSLDTSSSPTNTSSSSRRTSNIIEF